MSLVLIKNGTLVDPAKAEASADLYLQDGNVAGIGKKPKGFKAEKSRSMPRAAGSCRV